MNTSLFTDPKIIDPATGQPAVTLGAAMSRFLEVGLYVGGTLMFFWAVWGVFDYIKAEGNKEALAKARKRIQWAIAGFIILIMAFFISDLLQSVIAPMIGNRQTDPLSL